MSSREIIKLLQANGWFHVATVGDHWQFRHPESKGKVTVPHPTKDISIELLKSIESQSGLSLRKR